MVFGFEYIICSIHLLTMGSFSFRRSLSRITMFRFDSEFFDITFVVVVVVVIALFIQHLCCTYFCIFWFRLHPIIAITMLNSKNLKIKTILLLTDTDKKKTKTRQDTHTNTKNKTKERHVAHSSPSSSLLSLTV